MNILDTVKAALGKNAFLGILPDKPDSAIALFEYDGQAESFFDQTVSGYSVQARCRAKSQPEAYRLTEEVRAALDRYVGQGVAIRQTTPVLDIGQDEKGRREYTVNFKINPTGG